MTDRDGSVLEVLITRERAELARYCRDIRGPRRDRADRHGLAAGQSLWCSRGSLLACRFGGEGLFMTELTGPGWVMLQSLNKASPAKKAANAR